MLSQDVIHLDGHSLTLPIAMTIAGGASISLAPGALANVNNCRTCVEDIVQAGVPVYGINTGFGYFANKNISSGDLCKLQDNIVLSHAAGYGNPLSIPETRLAMALRLNVLVKGLTGVRLSTCQTLMNMINAGIYPIIPEYGSVGASGDLAPLAHLALALIGKGQVSYRDVVMPAGKALAAAGIEPVVLAEKEGLGLINGTQIMLAVGGLALSTATRLCHLADLVAALTYEGIVGSTAALDARIHEARGQVGQIASANAIREHLIGSYLYNNSVQRTRVQDPYSLRCAPQVHGASLDALIYSEQIISRELNAATDNPLVFPKTGQALSGGNFHGQPLAMAFDFAAIAVSELGNISERRLELLLNPGQSGLPAFLASKEGLESGYMAFQYLSASLVNEDKLLANPACTDSIPGNVGVEDHVSMGMTSARKLRKLVSNCQVILAVEALAACQAIDLRGVTPLGRGTRHLYDVIRQRVKPLTEDRIVSEDIEQAVKALQGLTNSI